MPPLHEAALSPDEVWGASLRMRCACGADMPLWHKRCPACRAVNPFGRLLKRRKRVERWIDRRIDADLFPEIERAELLPQTIEQYQRVLEEVLRRPVPEQQRNEDLARYLQRVVAFYPSMFKTTAPSRVAKEIGDRLTRSARAMSRAAGAGTRSFVTRATGLETPKEGEPLVQQQIEGVRRDLTQAITPYVEELKTLKIYHGRMVSAWAGARPILLRRPAAGKIKGAWNKVRSMANAKGRLLRFGTAIWRNTEEKERLQRLEAEILRFCEQVKRFVAQGDQFERRRANQRKTYRLSLRKHLLRRLSGHVAAARPEQRQVVVERILAQKGVGGVVWRWLFGRRLAAREPG